MSGFLIGLGLGIVIWYLLFGFVTWFDSDERDARSFFLWWKAWPW